MFSDRSDWSDQSEVLSLGCPRTSRTCRTGRRSSLLDVLGLVGLVGRVGGPLLHIPLLRALLITESEQGAGGSKKRKRGVFFSLEEVLGLVGPVGLVGKIGWSEVFRRERGENMFFGGRNGTKKQRKGKSDEQRKRALALP